MIFQGPIQILALHLTMNTILGNHIITIWLSIAAFEQIYKIVEKSM